MKIRLLSLLILIVGLLSACSTGPNVASDYDPAFDFSAIKSFHLVDKQRSSSDLINNRVIKAINSSLASRSIEGRESQKADILVDFLVVTKDKMRINQYNTGYGYNCFRCRAPYFNYGTGVDVQKFTEGSLIIDLVDPRKNTTVWRGIASAPVKNRMPQERTELINQYTEAIISAMPLRQ